MRSPKARLNSASTRRNSHCPARCTRLNTLSAASEGAGQGEGARNRHCEKLKATKQFGLKFFLLPFLGDVTLFRQRTLGLWPRQSTFISLQEPDKRVNTILSLQL